MGVKNITFVVKAFAEEVGTSQLAMKTILL